MASNETIRPALSGRRNGLPEPGGYVYRGGKEPGGWDVMPWAITDDDSMDYDRGVTGLPSMTDSAVSKRKERAFAVNTPEHASHRDALDDDQVFHRFLPTVHNSRSISCTISTTPCDSRARGVT